MRSLLLDGRQRPSCPVPTWPRLCEHVDSKMESSVMCLLVRAQDLSDQGLTFITSFNFNYFLRRPSSNKATLGGQGFNIWMWGWGDTNIQSKTAPKPIYTRKYIIFLIGCKPRWNDYQLCSRRNGSSPKTGPPSPPQPKKMLGYMTRENWICGWN